LQPVDEETTSGLTNGNAAGTTRQNDVPCILGNEDPHPAAVQWNNVISWSKSILLVLLFVILWPIGARSFKKFTAATDSTFHPIHGSSSDEAQSAFQQIYETDFSDPMRPALVLVLESTNQSFSNARSTVFAQARNFSLGLSDLLSNGTCWQQEDSSCFSDPWLQITSYYSLKGQGLSTLANALVASDGLTTVLQVQYLLPANLKHPPSRVSQLMDTIRSYGDLASSTVDFKISYTGIKWFQTDLIESTQKDLRRMDALVLPLALVLLGVVLPRARPSVVWIVPLVTMISTVCAWSVIMRFIVYRMQITQFTPSIMMSLTLGMGIDYTLFMLSRYLEDTTDRSRAIRHMIQQGGHVLLLSGLTLMCTFLGLCFLPLQMLKSVGVGAAIAIGCSLLVNLTVVPALLHTSLGDWIVQKSHTSPVPLISSRDLGLEQTGDGNDLILSSNAERHDNNNDENVLDQHELVLLPTPKTSWFQLSHYLLHPYKSVIIFLLICQLIAPVARHASQIKTSISFDLMLPSESPSLQAFQVLGKSFGWGRLTPYRILFDGHDANVTMTSAKGFVVMQRVVAELMAIDSGMFAAEATLQGNKEADDLQDDMDNLLDAGFKPERAPVLSTKLITMLDSISLQGSDHPRTSYAGISVLANIWIPHAVYNAAKVCAKVKPYCPIEKLHLLDVVDKSVTSSDQFASYVIASLGVNPFSAEGVAWLKQVRSVLDRLERAGALEGIQVYLQGAAAIENDAVEAVYAAFPKVIVITTIVVFVLMGIFFQSIFPPLRSIVSITLTLAFSFGLGVLVFQVGILNWTNVRALSSIGNEVCWLVPMMAFSIIVGLALDYDVFLISRILEYRQAGYEHKSSIAAGLDATGGIITAAGLIMTLSFGSLMMSSNPVLCQWAFLITVAVLLDTFVMRTLVVPIVTAWTGEHSWWPRKLPKERFVYILDSTEPDNTITSSHARIVSNSECEYEHISTVTPRTP
jgi:predicted RND superfamily exporter protein